MRRPAWTSRDALLFWGVLIVCAAAYVMHLNAIASEQLAWLPFTLAYTAPEGDPRVAFVRPDVPDTERDLVARGDRIVSIEGRSLRGRGGIGASLDLYSAAAHAEARRPKLERVRGDGERVPVTVSLVPVPHPWRASVLALSFLAIGALTYRRAARHPAARLFFLTAAAYALHWSYAFGGDAPIRNALAIFVFGVGVALAPPLALRAVLALTEDVSDDGRAARGLPWLFVVLGLGATTWAFGGPLPPATGQPLAVGASVAFLLTLAFVLVDRWRRTGPIGRRQIKWVVLGALLALIPPVFAGAITMAEPEWAWFYEVSLVSLALLPAGVFVAIVRDHLLDVDRLLTSTMLFSILGALLLAGVIVAVPPLAQATSGWLDPEVSQPGLGLAAAGGLLTLHRLVRPWIDDRLFPERVAFESGTEELRRELATCEKPSELFDALGRGLSRRLRISDVVVYGRADDVFAPLYDRGDAIAPKFAADGPLADLLADQSRMIDATTIEARMASEPGSATDRAALEAMGTELLLPILRDDVVEGFVCLGEKASGERYGSAELALLQSISDKVGDELRRFDLEEVHREEREMVRLLRGYVPSVVADRLARRVDMAAGECDVTVLFVDLRGYTNLSQRYGPERTFALVSRYTEAVSAIVDACGGTVVDFQGDGLMAVFGAPDPLPRKERAAVEAALAIVEKVRGRPIDDGDPASEATDLGIGIASGKAYAGPIRSIDRTIWGVLGDTTNLAARLQTLSRDLEATIVVDGPTRDGAADLMHGFSRHPDTPIRGRRGHVDVSFRPRRPQAAITLTENTS